MNNRLNTVVSLLTWTAIMAVCSTMVVFTPATLAADAARTQELEAQLKENPKDTKLLMELGIIYHSKALEGDKHALQRAEQVFKEVLKIEPDNAEAHAWYGSLLTIKGREDWFPLAKLFYVNQGIQEMDRAVELAPDAVMVRLVRAHTSLALPYMFGRTKVAIKDFEYLITLSQDRPEQFNVDTLAQIYLGLGKAYAKEGDKNKARENWQKVIELAPESREALEAKSLLEG
ncbi:MAG: tetratricopeptide repeat protein [Firmicutes bacterium]|nr:tetratricopeptide repeat protein [Bacillota bacterium]